MSWFALNAGQTLKKTPLLSAVAAEGNWIINP
jgi:hypothetical protein